MRDIQKKSGLNKLKSYLIAGGLVSAILISGKAKNIDNKKEQVQSETQTTVSTNNYETFKTSLNDNEIANINDEAIVNKLIRDSANIKLNEVDSTHEVTPSDTEDSLCKTYHMSKEVFREINNVPTNEVYFVKTGDVVNIRSYYIKDDEAVDRAINYLYFVKYVPNSKIYNIALSDSYNYAYKDQYRELFFGMNSTYQKIADTMSASKYLYNSSNKSGDRAEILIELFEDELNALPDAKENLVSFNDFKSNILIKANNFEYVTDGDYEYVVKSANTMSKIYG